MLQAGVTVGLGTDGVSAAGNLNLHRQIHLVAGLFKDAPVDPTLVGARMALRMATIEGRSFHASKRRRHGGLQRPSCRDVALARDHG